MSTWKDFEVQCTDYLNDKFGHYADFIHQGGADSTVPDILVKTRSGDSFYIDAKHSPAQCSQFVLLPDLNDGVFKYSSQNATLPNQYTKQITEYMNQDFDSFREAGTTGKEINMPDASDVFTGWIIQTYQNKEVRFFITNDFTILPVEQFSDYFKVSAKYRIKRSGSSNVGKKQCNLVMEHITQKNYNITACHIRGSKLFVESPRKLHDLRFILNGTEYMFSLRGNEYELRKLSNTYNANVIFSIKQKPYPGMSDDDFIHFLK